MSETPPRPMPLPILQILANLRGGSIVQEIQGELARVVKGVNVTGKAGKLTVVIGISPTPHVTNGVLLAAEISSKIPKPPRGADMLYADAQAGLHRSDPRQMDAFESMKPRVVGSGAVNVATGECLDEDGQASA